MASDPITEPPNIWWQCQRCGNCCRWAGDVHVSEDEICKIAQFVGMSDDQFIQRHTKLTKDRKGLTLLENKNGACSWLEGNECRLQPVKPKQCKGFPNDWNFDGWQQVCEALPLPISEKP